LHAAGEVSGGVHGNNRLGGNSLLECTVYGTIIGQKLPIKQRSNSIKSDLVPGKPKKEVESRGVSLSELAKHNSTDDCWIAIHGLVYDLTDFAQEHPAGPESIHDLAGKDGTEAFQAIHSKSLLDDFEDEKVGNLIT